MKKEIEIIDRIYYGIEELCEMNGVDVEEYMTDAVIEKYNLDKYGDLNEKINKIASEKTETTDKPTKKTNKTVRDEKTKIIEEKPLEKDVKDKEIIVVEERNISKNTDNDEISSLEVIEKPKRTKRTLKAK